MYEEQRRVVHFLTTLFSYFYLFFPDKKWADAKSAHFLFCVVACDRRVAPTRRNRCGAPGGFGTRPYEVGVGAAVIRQRATAGKPLPGKTDALHPIWLPLRGSWHGEAVTERVCQITALSAPCPVRQMRWTGRSSPARVIARSEATRQSASPLGAMRNAEKENGFPRRPAASSE